VKKDKEEKKGDVKKNVRKSRRPEKIIKLNKSKLKKELNIC
jgi:hypothetical protein